MSFRYLFAAILSFSGVICGYVEPGQCLESKINDANAAPSLPSSSSESKDQSIRSLRSEDTRRLNELDQNLKKNSLQMNVAKTLTLGLLGQTRKSNGTLKISKGQLRLELTGGEHSLLVINEKAFWAVSFPDADFNDSPVKVVTSSRDLDRDVKQNLLSVLIKGKMLEYFLPAGVIDLEGDLVSYFMQPKKTTGDFQRAQVTLNRKSSQLVGLKYWDARGNEVQFDFSEVLKVQSMDKSLFQYSPPSNAEIIKL